MSKLIENAIRAIDENSMLAEGDSVIAALSGGADSVAMLYTLISVKEKYKLTIYAAHLNHNLRGDEALRDENFVRALCEKEGIELFVRSVDVAKAAERDKIGTELCGRNIRYGFFDELSQKLSAKIATAHTASDNAETVIFNLIRGTGLKGIGGISPVRDNIIRPLIYSSRKDVEAFCDERSLSYVTDSTNLEDDYTRNRIRHKIIPVCKSINPDFEDSVTRSSKIFRDDNSYLELKASSAAEALRVKGGYSSEKFSKLHISLKMNLVYELCKAQNAEPDYKRVALVADCFENGGAVDLNDNVRAVCSQGIFRFVNKKEDYDEFIDTELRLPLEFEYHGKKYSVKEINYNSDKELLDISVLNRKPVFRTRRPGDSFTPFGRGVTKSVKKLFIEQKVPAEKRDSVLLLACGSEILWIEGIGASQSSVCKNDTGIKIFAEKG